MRKLAFISYALKVPFFLLVFVANAAATTLIYKDFDQLVLEADGVVEGVVQSIDTNVAGKTEVSRGHAYRDIKLNLVHFHDENGRTRGQDGVVLRILGGEVNGRYTDLVGAPDFLVGDHLVLFVTGNGSRLVPFVGWEQGVFRVNDRSDVMDNVGNMVLGKVGNRLSKEAKSEMSSKIVVDSVGTAKVGPHGNAPSSAVYGGGQSAQVSNEMPSLIDYGGGVQSNDMTTNANPGVSSSREAIKLGTFGDMIKEHLASAKQRGAHLPGSGKRSTFYSLPNPSQIIQSIAVD